MSGPVPEWLLTAFAAVTVFTVMLGIGLGIAPGELRAVWRRPGPMLRGLFSVLIAVPALALAVSRGFDFPRWVQIGIVLMAIAPGAPVALRRSLAAGGHHAFAPSLQICVALLAVASMPLSIAVLNHVYAGQASIHPWDVARQVCVAQLLPLGLGIVLRGAAPRIADRLEPVFARLGTALLVALAILAVIAVWAVVVRTGLEILGAIALITCAALAVGHGLGGPEPGTRTAVAIVSAARNPGLALLVAAANSAPPQVKAIVLAYLLVSAFTILPYMLWRRRHALKGGGRGQTPA